MSLVHEEVLVALTLGMASSVLLIAITLILP